MLVKTVEETAVPGDVIFAAAAKHERPVEALGEVGDGRLSWNRARQTVVAKELMVEFVRERVERRAACSGDSRLRPRPGRRRDRYGAQESGFQQVASKHGRLLMLNWRRRVESAAQTPPMAPSIEMQTGVEKRQGSSAPHVLRQTRSSGRAFHAAVNRGCGISRTCSGERPSDSVRAGPPGADL